MKSVPTVKQSAFCHINETLKGKNKATKNAEIDQNLNCELW